MLTAPPKLPVGLVAEEGVVVEGQVGLIRGATLAAAAARGVGGQVRLAIGQAVDRDDGRWARRGEGGRLDGEDPLFAAAVDDQVPGPRPLDRQALRDRQRTARQ